MTALVAQDLSFADEARWRFDFVGIIKATPAEVWDAFVDNHSWTIWCKNCRECTTTSDTVDGVGATRSISVGGMRVDERFIAWEPQRLWAFTVVDLKPGFATAMVERAEFEALVHERTRIDYRMAIQPKGWAVPMRRLVESQASRSFQQSFGELDKYIAATRPNADEGSA